MLLLHAVIFLCLSLPQKTTGRRLDGSSSSDEVSFSTAQNTWVKGHGRPLSLNLFCKSRGVTLSQSECESTASQLVADHLTGGQSRLGYYARTGRKARDVNGQDHLFFISTPSQISLGICDGHSSQGFFVAQTACGQLMQGLKQNPFPNNAAIPSANGYRTNMGDGKSTPAGQYLKDLFNRASSPDATEVAGGSTGTAIVIAPLGSSMIANSKSLGVFTANLGDSRGVMYVFKSPKIGVTKMHSFEELVSDKTSYSNVGHRWMTQEQSYSQPREMDHARAELLKLGYIQAVILDVKASFQDFKIELFGPKMDGNLCASLAALAKPGAYRTSSDVSTHLFRLAIKFNAVIWAIAINKPLMKNTRVVLRRIDPKDRRIRDINPSGGFGDFLFKPIMRKSPPTVRTAELIPSNDHSSEPPSS